VSPPDAAGPPEALPSRPPITDQEKPAVRKIAFTHATLDGYTALEENWRSSRVFAVSGAARVEE